MTDPRNAMDDADETLVERLETVEADNRRLRRLSLALIAFTAVLAGLAVAIMVVSAQYGLPGTTADIVAARQFVLRDQTGNPRGLWGVDDSGAVRLVLQDAGGRPRLRLSLLDDGGAGFSLSDSSGNNRAVVALLPDQAASLVLADVNGKTRSVLGLAADGSSTLVFADRTGVTRASLGVDSRGLGTISVSDRSGSMIQEPVVEDTVPADTTAGN